MKLMKQPNFEISGVIAKNISISGSKMNKVLSGRISFTTTWWTLDLGSILSMSLMNWKNFHDKYWLGLLGLLFWLSKIKKNIHFSSLTIHEINETA